MMRPRDDQLTEENYQELILELTQTIKEIENSKPALSAPLRQSTLDTTTSLLSTLRNTITSKKSPASNSNYAQEIKNIATRLSDFNREMIANMDAINNMGQVVKSKKQQNLVNAVNNISGLVLYEISHENNLEKRKRIAERWIDIMARSYKINDLVSAEAISAGIQLSGIKVNSLSIDAQEKHQDTEAELDKFRKTGEIFIEVYKKHIKDHPNPVLPFSNFKGALTMLNEKVDKESGIVVAILSELLKDELKPKSPEDKRFQAFLQSKPGIDANEIETNPELRNKLKDEFKKLENDRLVQLVKFEQLAAKISVNPEMQKLFAQLSQLKNDIDVLTKQKKPTVELVKKFNDIKAECGKKLKPIIESVLRDLVSPNLLAENTDRFEALANHFRLREEYFKTAEAEIALINRNIKDQPKFKKPESELSQLRNPDNLQLLIAHVDRERLAESIRTVPHLMAQLNDMLAENNTPKVTEYLAVLNQNQSLTTKKEVQQFHEACDLLIDTLVKLKLPQLEGAIDVLRFKLFTVAESVKSNFKEEVSNALPQPKLELEARENTLKEIPLAKSEDLSLREGSEEDYQKALESMPEVPHKPLPAHPEHAKYGLFSHEAAANLRALPRALGGNDEKAEVVDSKKRNP